MKEKKQKAQARRTFEPSIEAYRTTPYGGTLSDASTVSLAVAQVANEMDVIRLAVRAMNEEARPLESFGGAAYGVEAILARCASTLFDAASAVDELGK